MPKIIDLSKPTIYFGVKVVNEEKYITVGTYASAMRISKKISIYNRKRDAEALLTRAARRLNLLPSDLTIVEVEITPQLIAQAVPVKAEPAKDDQDEILRKKILRVFCEQLGVSETSLDEYISDETSLDDLGADSLDAIELVMALEDEFDIEISDDEAERLTDFKQTVNLIRTKITSS